MNAASDADGLLFVKPRLFLLHHYQRVVEVLVESQIPYRMSHMDIQFRKTLEYIFTCKKSINSTGLFSKTVSLFCQ
jgi:hypothetical protein